MIFPLVRPLPTQHTLNTGDEHSAFSGTGTRDSRNRAAADLRLRPHGLRESFLLHLLHANQRDAFRRQQTILSICTKQLYQIQANSNARGRRNENSGKKRKTKRDSNYNSNKNNNTREETLQAYAIKKTNQRNTQKVLIKLNTTS